MSSAGLAGAPSSKPRARQQCAGAVLMIRPAAFDYNPQTAATNKLQQPASRGKRSPQGGGPPPPAAQDSAQERALGEFEAFTHALRSEGVSVCVVDDTPLPPKPDAVFPNNWLSFHEDGTLVLYPMQAENRRRERRPEIAAAVARELGFK